MLYIQTIGDSIEWRVGEPVHASVVSNGVLHVQWVEAYGDELQYLWNRFGFIRNGKHAETTEARMNSSFDNMEKYQRWYGDDAKFIVGNLT